MYNKNAMTRDDLVIQGIAKRRMQYPQFISDFDKAAVNNNKLIEFTENGYLPYQAFIERDLALTMSNKVDEMVKNGESLQLPRDLTGPIFSADEYFKVGRVSQNIVDKGVDAFRDKTHMVQIKAPLLNFPELVKIGLNEELIDLVGAYMGCLPSLGFIKITKSLVNDLPPFDTQLFHIDGNAAKMVKAFLLLSDVDNDSGPHMVVKNSHKDRFDGCFDKLRWTEAEMESSFGKDRIYRHFGKAGDLVLEDTSAFHCGLKPRSKDRTIVVFNYVPHDEYGGGGPSIQAPKSILGTLTEKQKCTADSIEFI